VRIQFVTSGRPFRAPRAAILASAVVLLLGAVVVALPHLENGPVVCPFRAVTGLPCATCGLITSARHLSRGHVLDALRTNPFDAVFLMAVAPAFLAVWIGNLTRGLALRFSLSSAERRVGWTLLALALAANWIYVLRTRM
jgi:hypothetical protein